ncbi:MAG: PAS domain S-box protein, partial [Desulfobacterales bacterium]|nr:PAS domain S-box protein [Desulfobacterales bacterium]
NFSGEEMGDEMRTLSELYPIFSAIHTIGQELLSRNSELGRQKAEFQRLIDLVPCSITVQDRNLKLVEVNSEFREIFSPEKGAYCYEAYKGRSTSCPNCPVKKTFEDGNPHSSYEMGLNRDGTTAHWFVKTFPIHNEKGEITAVMELCHDTTEVRQLVEELQHTENRYYAIFNSITTPVFVVDPEKMEIVDCNTGAEYLYGYDHDEITGAPFSRLFKNSADAKLPVCTMDACYIERLRHVDCDGETIWVSMGAAGLEHSEKPLALVTCSDITRIVQAEEQMIHAGKMATLGTMATGVAHELNQPLTVIKSSIGVIRRRMKAGKELEPEMMEELLTEMDLYVDRAAQIINDMREFGRKDDARLEPVDLVEVVEKAGRMFKEQFRLREVHLTLKHPEEMPRIMAEPYRMEQVVINLLVNARDSVCKRWDDGDQSNPRKVGVELIKRPYGVDLAVCDNGTGMDEKIKKQIFDPFFTTKGPGEGTGIGLSISDNIVREYGGIIHVWSQPGRGSRFTLSFPAAP